MIQAQLLLPTPGPPPPLTLTTFCNLHVQKFIMHSKDLQNLTKPHQTPPNPTDSSPAQRVSAGLPFHRPRSRPLCHIKITFNSSPSPQNPFCGSGKPNYFHNSTKVQLVSSLSFWCEHTWDFSRGNLTRDVTAD